MFEELPNLHAQRFDLEGLDHVVGGAALHRFHRRGNGARGRQDDHRRPRLRKLRQHVEPTPPRHHEVEQDEVRRRRSNTGQRFVRVGGDVYVALQLEEHSQRLLD
ncbi:MAG: hypothetical protein JRG83_13025 [Deltaproteobacteria bacterium]|nr:hypothetical protein [Deltaproteobacteria bacterium]